MADAETACTRAALWALALGAVYLPLHRWLTPRRLSDDDKVYWVSCLIGTAHALVTGVEAVRYLFWSRDLSLFDSFDVRHHGWENVLQF